MESYDPKTNTWRVEEANLEARNNGVAWVAGDYIYFGGGGSSSGNRLQSVEKYSPTSKTWSFVDTLPQAVDGLGTAVVNNRIFIVSGRLGNSAWTNKVYAADLLTNRDLYFRSVVGVSNQEPNSILASRALTIQENQPIGSVVGEFNATDPDANAT